MRKKIMDKLGPYITKLMTTVLDKEQEEFVKDLAWNELRRLGENISEFVAKNVLKTDSEAPEIDKTEKQLLQEENDAE